MCTVTAMYITCMQTMLHVHKNPCTALIPLCRNYLNLPLCLFILPCAWLINQEFVWIKIFSIKVSKKTLMMISSCIIVKIVNCFCHWCYQPATIGNYLSRTHPPTVHPHRSLCFKRIGTNTTAVFFISNKEVVNP